MGVGRLGGRDLTAAVLLAGALLLGVSAALQLPLPDTVAGQPTSLLLAAGVLMALLMCGLHLRGRARIRTREAIALAVQPRLGTDVVVTAKRWDRWALPGWVRIGYRATLDDSDIAWAARVADLVSHRLDVDYTVAAHDARAARVLLTRHPGTAPAEPTAPEAQQRTERVAREVLGPSAMVTVDLGEDNMPTRIGVRHSAGVRVSTPAQRARIERALSSMWPGRWRARWDLVQDHLELTHRPVLGTRIPRPVTDPAPGGEIPLAVDEDGYTLTWAPTGKTTPHLLVTGATETGKTVIMRGAVMDLCRRGYEVVVADPKRIEFNTMRDWPGVAFVATTVPEQVALIHHVDRIMQARYEAIELGQAKVTDFHRICLVLDEYRQFYGVVGTWYATVKQKGMPSKPPVLATVGELAQMGRSAGVHLIIGTQRPDADFLTGVMRDNFRGRFSLGRLSFDGARMVWGEDVRTSMEVAMGIRGRGAGARPDGTPVEAQGLWTPDPGDVSTPQDAALLDALRPASSPHPPLRCVHPTEEDKYWAWGTAEFRPATAAEPVPVPPAFTGFSTLLEHDEHDQATGSYDKGAVAPAASFGAGAAATSPSPARTSPVHVPGLRHLHAVPASSAAVAEDQADSEDQETADEVSSEEVSPLLVTDLQVGQSVELEEGSGQFVLVEDVRVVDDGDDELVEIDYLDPATDEAGQMAVDASTVLWARA